MIRYWKTTWIVCTLQRRTKILELKLFLLASPKIKGLQWQLVQSKYASPQLCDAYCNTVSESHHFSSDRVQVNSLLPHHEVLRYNAFFLLSAVYLKFCVMKPGAETHFAERIKWQCEKWISLCSQINDPTCETKGNANFPPITREAYVSLRHPVEMEVTQSVRLQSW